MFVFRCLFFSMTCLQLLDPVVSPEAQVKPGQDAILKCHSDRNVTIALVMWKKQDLKKYVFFYRDNRSIENYQNEFFRGRVELKDPKLKDGDVSVILKNVTINDTGRYECYTGMSRLISLAQLNYIFNLTVEDPGGDGGNMDGVSGLAVGLTVVSVVVVIVVVVGFVICCQRSKKKKIPPDEVNEQLFESTSELSQNSYPAAVIES